MILFKALILIFALSFASGSLFGLEAATMSKIPTFVRGIITDCDSRDTSFHDIVLLRQNEFKETKQSVDDLFSEVVQAVGSNSCVVLPKSEQVVTHGHIRKASFVIIVSDFNTTVRRRDL